MNTPHKSVENMYNITTTDYGYYVERNLKSAPRQILGNLDCYENVNLTSLDNFPDYVGGNFYCFGASNLPYKELILLAII